MSPQLTLQAVPPILALAALPFALLLPFLTLHLSFLLPIPLVTLFAVLRLLSVCREIVPLGFVASIFASLLWLSLDASISIEIMSRFELGLPSKIGLLSLNFLYFAGLVLTIFVQELPIAIVMLILSFLAIAIIVCGSPKLMAFHAFHPLMALVLFFKAPIHNIPLQVTEDLLFVLRFIAMAMYSICKLMPACRARASELPPPDTPECIHENPLTAPSEDFLTLRDPFASPTNPRVSKSSWPTVGTLSRPASTLASTSWSRTPTIERSSGAAMLSELPESIGYHYRRARTLTGSSSLRGPIRALPSLAHTEEGRTPSRRMHHYSPSKQTLNDQNADFLSQLLLYSMTSIHDSPSKEHTSTKANVSHSTETPDMTRASYPDVPMSDSGDITPRQSHYAVSTIVSPQS